MNNKQPSRSEMFFQFITEWPKTILAIGLMVILATAVFIPTIQKDTRSDAFMPPDHPALIYQDKVEDIFGLKDPMVITVVNEGEHGVFNPHTLALVERLTQELEKLDNIDLDRVTSLATENNIFGTEDGMLVEPFFETAPLTQAGADNIRSSVMAFPLYLGSLVSRQGTATLIVTEMIDQSGSQSTYDDLLALAARAPKDAGESIHVAGEGAVSGYMGAYIDADAMRLNPIAALIITLVLFIAFRTLRGTMLPNFVVLGTVASALGVMAAFNVPFFVITNALPVVLIGIAVADSIHILSQYYEEVSATPEDDQRQIVIRAMQHMWKPVTLTTLTTMAGFIGLSIASVMPPMTYFGIFATLGVAVAWLFSMTVVPAGLSMLKLKPSRAYQSAAQADYFGSAMSSLGRVVIKRPALILTLALMVAMTGLIGASKLEINEDRITTFQQDEPIVLADSMINGHLDGSHYLDIVIETPDIEDLHKPDNLKRIEALQAFVQTLPHVKGSTSIVDYLKQMNRSLNENKPDAYQLPEDANLVAQYLLLYSASGDPTDFQEEVDYDYRLANVRVRMDSGKFSDEKSVVEAVETYLEQQFNGREISANLSGRVNVDYHWIKRLGDSHFDSVAISLLLVWLMATISLRSFTAGTMTIIPVALSILLIYAVMGFTGIWLGVGTSMFAAIAIGLGVDFAVHTVQRMAVLMRDEKLSINRAIEKLYPSTGRALLFNFAALALGFGVLVSSEVVPLTRFGSLVFVAVSVSFLASMTVLPALIKVLKPKFVGVSDMNKPDLAKASLEEAQVVVMQRRNEA